MAASRHPPVVGAPARVVHLGRTEAVTIVAVDGPRVTVAHDDGRVERFGLHRLTGQFVRDGGPVTNPRLLLGPAPDAGRRD